MDNKYLKTVTDEFSKSHGLTFNPRCELVKINSENHLYLEGGIYDEEGYISAKSVREKLDGDVVIHLNSPGGSTFEGVAIYNALKDHPGKVTVQIDGIAASAASVIAMGADVIRARPTSMMMIHNCWSFAVGNSKELMKIAETLQKVDESSNKAYMEKFNGSQEELEKMLDDETYLTAEDAYAVGLVDEIMDKAEETEPVKEPEEEQNAEPETKSLFDKFKASDKGVNFYANFRRM